MASVIGNILKGRKSALRKHHVYAVYARLNVIEYRAVEVPQNMRVFHSVRSIEPQIAEFGKIFDFYILSQPCAFFIEDAATVIIS